METEEGEATEEGEEGEAHISPTLAVAVYLIIAWHFVDELHSTQRSNYYL